MPYERPVAPTPTANYPAYEHVEMQRQVTEEFDPALAGRIADEWKAIGATLTELAVDFTVIVNGSEAGWTGSAAEGARAALAKVGEFSDLTGDHFTATGAALQAQTNVAAEAKARMPKPVEFNPGQMLLEGMGGGIVGVAALPVTMPLRWAESEGAKAQAVQVMRDRDEGMRSATSSMPGFDEVPSVTRDQGVMTSTAQTSSTSTSTIDPSSRVGAADLPGGPRDLGGTTSTSWAAPPAVAPPGTTPPSAAPPAATVPTGPSTLPQGWVPGPPGGTRPPTGAKPEPLPGPGALPPGVLPPGGRPGPSGGPGGRGGAGGGGRGGSGRGGSGGARGGVPGGLPGRGGVPGASGTSSGVAPGRGPATGFGPPGAGAPGGAAAGQAGARGGAQAAGVGAAAGTGAGTGEEDQEHKAKYLIPTDEYFDDNRLVAPPTIGE